MDENYHSDILKPDLRWSKSTIFLAILIFSTGFILALFASLKKTSTKEEISPVGPMVPSLTTFQLKPPAQSLTGQITKVTGKIEFEGRDEKEYRPIGITTSVVVGDKIITGENAQATIEFPPVGKIQLEENAEISFLHLLPESFLIEQFNGTVEYSANGNHDVSVKNLHGLMTFSSSDVRMSTFPDEERIVVRIVSGEAKIAFVDLHNDTQVFTLKQGQRVTIDDRRRTFYR